MVKLSDAQGYQSIFFTLSSSPITLFQIWDSVKSQINESASCRQGKWFQFQLWQMSIHRERIREQGYLTKNSGDYKKKNESIGSKVQE